MNKFPPRLLKVLVVLSVIVALIAGWWIYSVYRFSRPWRGIAREDTEAQVLKALGKPQYVYDGEDEEPMKETYEKENGEFTTAGRSVKKEFEYDSFLFGPYVIGFDSNGRVVVKGHNTLCCSQ